MMKLIKNIAISALIVISSASYADAAQTPVEYLQEQWAIDNYQLNGKEQKAAFIALIEHADTLILSHPESADLYIWRGIVKSTYAGIKGGVGALKYAKAAKADLEKALTLDPDALQGSAYTSLGTLYFNVPGWPIGFGNSEKAEALLTNALALNPDGIDPNYFYGNYLKSEKRYADAKRHMTKALQAKPRAGRELADKGRREEIQQALEDIEQHL